MELKRLTPEVVNKLRSGVAIVSIAHCMEELVLNALDAGATCIAVRLNMPYHKVQVVDNGHGMSRDQLENCGERYCTSKCRTVSDLAHPKFYGYRGEALSSIVEMSGLVQIESKSSSCPQSCCKTFAQGKLRELAPSTANRPSAGTTVTVLDFMYNLPVRRGCVSEAIDFEFCLQHLEGIALSHPEVSFTLRNDVTGEKQFQTHKTSSVLDSFAQLFGARKAATLKQAFLKHKKTRRGGLHQPRRAHDEAAPVCIPQQAPAPQDPSSQTRSQRHQKIRAWLPKQARCTLREPKQTKEQTPCVCHLHRLHFQNV